MPLDHPPVSSDESVRVFRSRNCSDLPHLYSSGFLFLPDIFAGCLPRPTSAADKSVTWLSPRLWYYTAVRLLTERRSPFRLRLSVRLPRCHSEILPVLLRSRFVLPYRAVRKHLGAVGE